MIIMIKISDLLIFTFFCQCDYSEYSFGTLLLNTILLFPLLYWKRIIKTRTRSRCIRTHVSPDDYFRPLPRRRYSRLFSFVAITFCQMGRCAYRAIYFDSSSGTFINRFHKSLISLWDSVFIFCDLNIIKKFVAKNIITLQQYVKHWNYETLSVQI